MPRNLLEGIIELPGNNEQPARNNEGPQDLLSGMGLSPKSEQQSIWNDIKGFPGRVGENIQGLVEPFVTSPEGAADNTQMNKLSKNTGMDPIFNLLRSKAADEVSGVIQQQLADPQRAWQNQSQGAMSGINTAAQIPANISRYFESRGGLPEGYTDDSWMQSLADSSNKALDNTTKQLQGAGLLRPEGDPSQPGDALTQGAFDFALFLGAGLPGIGMHAIGKNEDPLAAMAGPKIIQNAPAIGRAGKQIAKQGADKLVKTPAKWAGKKAVETSKKVADKFREPLTKAEESYNKDIKSFNDSLEKMEAKHAGSLEKPQKLIEMQEKEIGQLKDSMLEINNEQISVGKQYDNAQKNVETIVKETSPKDISRARVETAKTMKSAHKDIRAEGHKMYEDYSKSDAGQRSIKVESKVDPRKIGNITNADHIGQKSKALMDKVLGKAKKTPSNQRVSSSGAPRPEWEVTEGSHRVGDYVTLSKDLRDISSGLSRDMKAPNTKIAERNALIGQKAEVNALRAKVDKAILDSTSKAEAAAYQKIQDHWRTKVTPWDEKSVLSNALDNNPSMKSKNLMEALSKEGIPDLVDALVKREDFSRAVSAQDMAGMNVKTLSGVKKLSENLSGDLGRTLGPEKTALLEAQVRRVLQSDEMIAKMKGELVQKGVSKAEAQRRMDGLKKDLKKQQEVNDSELRKFKDEKVSKESASKDKLEAAKQQHSGKAAVAKAAAFGLGVGKGSWALLKFVTGQG